MIAEIHHGKSIGLHKAKGIGTRRQMFARKIQRNLRENVALIFLLNPR